MNRRFTSLAIALAALLAAAGAYYYYSIQPRASAPSAPSSEESQEIRRVVTEFGKQLQMVSLTAEPDIAADAIQKYYAPYVSTALLAQWKNNPAKAPGRVTSSPWPDRIEIDSAVKEGEEFYRVEGEVIEVTNADNDRATARYPITLEIGRDWDEGKWVITATEVGTYE